MAPVQFITHYTGRYSYVDSAHMALEGGCRWVQLRMKNVAIQEILPVAREIQQLCRAYEATFIIDDYVELAQQLHADGVHLGTSDMPIAEARRVLGSGFIIGGTANTFDDIQKHYAAGADYIGCGPFRYTDTKQNLKPLLGLDGYKDILARMRQESITIPLVAIGGITMDDISPLLAIGVNGIALSGTVLRANDPIEEMRKIIRITENR